MGTITDNLELTVANAVPAAPTALANAKKDITNKVARRRPKKNV